MKAHQATYPVRVMGRLLGVSASGFYAWKNREPSRRALQDIALTARIRAIHRRSGEAYGAPSIHAELADDHDIRVGRKRVARLMRVAGLKGLHPVKFVTTTVADPAADRALDKVDRQFNAEGPDRLWVADITYVPTWSGFLYLAIVLDVWSRRIVGWAMANHLKTELVLDALDMALAQRRPESVIHHSDRGCQYTSYAFGKRCREAGVVPSMGSTGDAYDNAMAESFFATLEREVLNRRRFSSQAEARMAIFQWLEGWY
ncbi:MAG TPA: IS3 family transposase, partial [Woeseiaceae bacterium]|nr:IS3 family transposase [Woeseiaceae bacterium]